MIIFHITRLHTKNVQTLYSEVYLNSLFLLPFGCLVTVNSISDWAWRQWPDGDYAIPMSVYGCSDQELNNWQHSQNHAVHYVKYAWGVNSKDIVTLKDDVLNLGPIGLNSNTFQVNYCVKHSTSNGQRMRDVEWPRGNYAIFPTNYVCPIGKHSRLLCTKYGT